MNLSKEQYKRLIMFALSMLIIAIEIIMFAYLWEHDYRILTKTNYYRKGNWAIIAIYGVLAYTFAKVFSALKVGYLKTLDIMYSQVLAIFSTNAVTYIQMDLIGNWRFLTNVKPIIILTIAELIVALVWAIISKKIYALIYPPYEMILIYGTISPRDIIDKVRRRSDKYHIKETINIDIGIKNVLKEVDKYESVLIGDLPSHERNLFIKYCYSHSKRCYCLPKISDIMITASTKIDLFDTQFQLFRNSGLTFGQTVAKRLVDIITSIIGIIFGSPLMLIIAVFIKSYDGGPVFYKQERLTTDGKPFKILKFRSMVVDSEKNGARLASAHDDRITPVGKVIRRLHFDEIPQLFNILLGDMSLVGPRPEREVMYREYENEIPEYRFRLKMKAGLTGYAQVYGNYSTVPYDKLKLDLMYIENYSIWLDFRLILLTIKILFQKEKSEGVDDKQRTALKNKN
ncbi:exopolysaccharide biosynthesis polyprenyl glycosylphosphotransferase [Acetitomaculum ruminis DSM 5522]|uniref:Exopolysaccharide biosynthesis polyprenyl glycosylphosphotransferase n=1 Tax=Acetitomaculum ruminis DSM 5522 TaxID=1120918 RepID=A0A1I0VNA9_9FIRM|nr:sugar transferase [Acetitomaculum ruminis]SFA77477.1 exopolysaccharide biosynthesis polyprenyl glycosylphosphotransferase [Acetitomaculum ruminis DSM 5522]